MLTRRGSSVSTDEKQPLNKDHADQDLKKDPDHVSTLQTKQTDNEFDSELDIEQPSVESRNTHVTEEREPMRKKFQKKRKTRSFHSLVLLKWTKNNLQRINSAASKPNKH